MVRIPTIKKIYSKVNVSGNLGDKCSNYIWYIYVFIRSVLFIFMSLQIYVANGELFVFFGVLSLIEHFVRQFY